MNFNITAGTIARTAVLLLALTNQILSACEDKIRELAKGPAVAHLSAQVRAKGFYRKNGYVESGEEYLDEYCPHISMSKQL